MLKIRIYTLLCVLLTSMLAVSQTTQKHRAPCPLKTSPPGWPTYIDDLHGFCFSYPPSYEPVAEPWAERYIQTSDTKEVERLRKAVRQRRMLRLQNKEEAGGSIVVFLEVQPFNLKSFVDRAPTGIDSPPQARQLGPNRFYYYGPGGGGVQYPDQYFFDLRGKTLDITFDGPYVFDKTPSLETKQMEEQMLLTFRTFALN